ncbi:uncharacterized protein LOC101463480 [Ceratitis capitata]|uniref:uncharacterized protein LOC101463480 n=1 Tax=Ceratitis capitata TaxID=7213 RepID=UPI000329FA3F|nr:uncharacterized protein LOC101463480 [Ceratitis capitata]XP_012160120.1 uncharacterized protein LOC101463480 [Ceratitis capitata]XP_012160121.1 uncharacterized protein LOC101463480 [Ceratitis capitata]
MATNSIKSYIVSKYQGLCNYMERDTIGTQVAIYGTSGLMLLIAYIKRKPAYLVRPFKKPSHIPEKLINERVMHTGLIRDVQVKNQDTILLISHRPLIPIFASKDRVLPVKLPGIKVNGNGVSWLQSCVLGQRATFIPLVKSKRDDFVVSQLCLVHPPKGGRLIDISETLLKLCFARYAPDEAAAIKRNIKYYDHLKKVEASALTKQSWFFWLAKHPSLWSTLREAKAKVFSKKTLLPELVR